MSCDNLIHIHKYPLCGFNKYNNGKGLDFSFKHVVNTLLISRMCFLILHITRNIFHILYGTQWLSGRVLDSRPRGRRFEPHRGLCVVILEQDTFILV